MTRGLATLVAGIWTEAGYETTISHRDGDTYVLAEHEAAGTYDLLWVLGADEEITVDHVERYRSRIADLDVADAYVVAPTSVADDVATRAARRGIEAVGVETLRSLADQSGVGQVAVDAALATTVGPDEPPGASDPSEKEGVDAAPDERDDADEDDSPGVLAGLDDPTRQAEIRQRLSVMIGESDPDEDPAVEEESHGAAAGRDDGASDGREAAETAGAAGTDGGDRSASADGEDGGAGESDDADGGGIDLGTDDADDADDGPGEAPGDDAPDPFAESELPEDPELTDTEDPDSGGGGPLRSRRGVVTGGVAAVLTAGVLDFAMFNVLLGGGDGGMPAYNETRVKTEATTYPPETITSVPEEFEDVAVVYEDAVVTTVEADGDLWSVTMVVGGGTVVGRWDGEEPTIGTGYTVWGVVTGTTTVEGDDVPTIDVVDMAEPGAGEETATGDETTDGEG